MALTQNIQNFLGVSLPVNDTVRSMRERSQGEIVADVIGTAVEAGIKAGMEANSKDNRRAAEEERLADEAEARTKAQREALERERLARDIDRFINGGKLPDRHSGGGSTGGGGPVVT